MYTAAILFVLGSMHWRRSSVMSVSVLMCCVPSSAAWACYQAHSVVLTVSRQLLSLPLPRQRSRLAGSRTESLRQGQSACVALTQRASPLQQWRWSKAAQTQSDGGARRWVHGRARGCCTTTQSGLAGSHISISYPVRNTSPLATPL